MKILLVRPPARFFGDSAKPSASIPIGLLSVAAALESKGHDVEILDAQIDVAQPVYRDPDGTTYVGRRWEDVEGEISRKNPDIVGISNMFTVQVEGALRLAGIAKKVNPKIFTVVGGAHATARPKDFFAGTDAVDLVCRGEGELTMLEVVESLEAGRDGRGISGTVTRTVEGLSDNPPRPFIRDLDQLPLPAYHLIDLGDYFALNASGYSDRPMPLGAGFQRAVSVVTSRGCPFDCVFCSINGHMGRSWRFHSVPYIMEHLKLLIQKYGVRHIHFEDDNLTLDPARFKAILGGLSGQRLGLTWDTPNGVRVDTLTEELLGECKRNGCIYLIFGVESGNQRVLNEIIRKRLDLDVVVRVASWCRKLGLDAMAFFVIGFPGESRKEMEETVRFALDLQRRYDVAPSLFVATPLPGTRLEEICLEKGYLHGALASEVLAKMTSGAVILETEKGQSENIRSARTAFYKGFKQNFIRNALIFFLRHPKASVRFGRQWLKQKKTAGAKEAAVNLLAFKNCLLRPCGPQDPVFGE